MTLIKSNLFHWCLYQLILKKLFVLRKKDTVVVVSIIVQPIQILLVPCIKSTKVIALHPQKYNHSSTKIYIISCRHSVAAISYFHTNIKSWHNTILPPPLGIWLPSSFVFLISDNLPAFLFKISKYKRTSFHCFKISYCILNLLNDNITIIPVDCLGKLSQVYHSFF